MKYALSFFCCALLFFGFTTSGISADAASLYKRCVSCHGPDGSKAPHPVKGQNAQDLLKKMQGYAAGTYGGEQKVVMRNLLKPLTPDDLQTLAEYIEKL